MAARQRIEYEVRDPRRRTGERKRRERVGFPVGRHRKLLAELGAESGKTMPAIAAGITIGEDSILVPVNRIDITQHKSSDKCHWEIQSYERSEKTRVCSR